MHGHALSHSRQLEGLLSYQNCYVSFPLYNAQATLTDRRAPKKYYLWAMHVFERFQVYLSLFESCQFIFFDHVLLSSKMAGSKLARSAHNTDSSQLTVHYHSIRYHLRFDNEMEITTPRYGSPLHLCCKELF